MDKNEQQKIDELQHRLAQQEQEIARLRAELEHLARHDALTGALNRRALTDLLAAELRRALRTGHPFCFAAIAIDGFGDMAERYGAPAADAVMQRFAGTATGVLRSLDAFGRLDEQCFGILLPATWLDQGVLALGRLTAAIKIADWQSVAPGLAPGFSAGLTTNAPGDSADMIVERSQQALAQARQDGGGRVATLECELPPMPPLPED